jgi:hypothetical protein
MESKISILAKELKKNRVSYEMYWDRSHSSTTIYYPNFRDYVYTVRCEYGQKSFDVIRYLTTANKRKLLYSVSRYTSPEKVLNILKEDYQNKFKRQRDIIPQYEVERTIQNVIFNPPATIVFWQDGTKTVVKCCPDDTFDKEKGLAMAICKKFYDNTSKFYKVFEKWCENDKAGEVEANETMLTLKQMSKAIRGHCCSCAPLCSECPLRMTRKISRRN